MRLVASSAGLVAYALVLAFGLWLGLMAYQTFTWSPDQQIDVPSSTVNSSYDPCSAENYTPINCDPFYGYDLAHNASDEYDASYLLDR